MEQMIRKKDGTSLRVQSPYEVVAKEDGSLDIVKPASAKQPAKVVATLKHGEWGSVTEPYDPTPKASVFSEGG